MKKNLLLLALCSSAFAFSAPLHPDHTKMDQDIAQAASTTEYQQAMSKMHQSMDIDYSGNADIDFAKGMIPHHQAAIDMAKTQLKYGKDARLRAMSKDIIKAQTHEIQILESWLKQHEKR
ncbi:DUF305 domain-containing protein [Snodgrassella sp. CFCC 13594]|uniref:CopM family metallochaperone n=1 Tax=Snodgrassella sp. CFCC 13594 TaxID=1775559 RepID=UPI0009EF5816|nr:DUF305 domain-containing protein [Snodgrassella sp. CFCC 13594]